MGNSLNRHSKAVGGSLGKLQSPETSGELGGLTEATGPKAAWAGATKDTGRAQSEGCGQRRLHRGSYFILCQGPRDFLEDSENH